MVKKITEKVIAIILVTIMLLAYASTIGINARRVYALENSIEVQGVKTNNENVEFDAYFVNGNSKVHETENKIGGENSIYLSVNVKNAGYLQNAKIHFLGKDNNSKANFTIKDLAQENNVVTKINTQQNIVELNQINKNEQANIQIPISFNSQDKISLEEFSKESKAYFTAKYIDENGSEKQISSEIVIKINWTNDVEVALEQQVTKYVPYTFNGKAEVMLQTVIKSSI